MSGLAAARVHPDGLGVRCADRILPSRASGVVAVPAIARSTAPVPDVCIVEVGNNQARSVSGRDTRSAGRELGVPERPAISARCGQARLHLGETALFNRVLLGMAGKDGISHLLGWMVGVALIAHHHRDIGRWGRRGKGGVDGGEESESAKDQRFDGRHGEGRVD